MRRFALWLLVVLGACRTGPQPRPDVLPDTGVRVVELKAAFPSETTGTVSLTLELEPSDSAARVERLTYELWLSGRRFASGTELLDLPLRAGELERLPLELPLTFQRQAMQPGPVALTVELKGTLRVREEGSDPERRAFAWRGGVLAQGAPTFEDEDAED